MLYLCWPQTVPAQTESALTDKPAPSASARIYRSPSERREAGLGIMLTDDLKFSGLLELEQKYLRQRNQVKDSRSEKPLPVSTLQLAVDLTLGEVLRAEYVFEAEHDNRTRSGTDEALIELELDDWGIKAGKLYLPFGEFYSHFVSGPILEFGETRASGLVVDYALSDTLELGAFVFDSEISPKNADKKLDWGVFSEISNEDESSLVGIAYLSDLAESEELSEEFAADAIDRQVSALSAYAFLAWQPFELTAELIRAKQGFTAEPFTDTLRASNLELTYYSSASTQLSLRLEQSQGLPEQPKRQWGISFAWRLNQRLGFSLDYLYGKFAYQNNDTEDDPPLEKQELLAAQLYLEL